MWFTKEKKKNRKRYMYILSNIECQYVVLNGFNVYVCVYIYSI